MNEGTMGLCGILWVVKVQCKGTRNGKNKENSLGFAAKRIFLVQLNPLVKVCLPRFGWFHTHSYYPYSENCDLAIEVEKYDVVIEV